MPAVRKLPHFVFAFLFDGKGGAKALDEKAVMEWDPSMGVLWTHLNYTDAASRNWLKNKSGLDKLSAEALLSEETRPRITPHDGGLLIALRGINLNPGAEPDDMVSVRLWVDNMRIISTGKRELLSLRDVIQYFKEEQGPQSSGDFLVQLINRLVWRMSDTINNLEDLIDDMEDLILDSGTVEPKNELANLRRQTISLRRYLAPQREALSRLSMEKIAWMNDEHRLHLREVLNWITRHLEDLDAVRERASVMQEELLSRLSDQLNRRIYVLSIIAAIFLPLSFLTGLLGINVAGIPGAENPSAFTVFVGIILVIIVLQLSIFHWRKWL